MPRSLWKSTYETIDVIHVTFIYFSVAIVSNLCAPTDNFKPRIFNSTTKGLLMMQIHKVHEGLPLILLLPLYLSFVRAVKLEESASTVSAIPRFPVSVGSIQIPATWNDTSYVLPSLGTNHASDHLSSGTNGFSSAFHTAIRGSSIFPTSTEVAASSGSFLPSQTSTSTFSSILPSPTSKVASSSETSVIKGALVTAAPQSMRLISTAPTESAAIVQVSRFGDTVLDFATNGRAWANDITIPRVKIQAIHQIENMLGNSKNIIENLEGKVPPSLGPCSEAGYVHFHAKDFYHTFSWDALIVLHPLKIYYSLICWPEEFIVKESDSSTHWKR